MDLSSIPRRRLPLLLLAYLAAWAIPSLVSITQLSLSYSLRGDNPPLSLLLKIVLPGWYGWALIAPVIAVVAWRIPLRRAGWVRQCLLHLCANALVAAAWVAVVVNVRRFFELPGSSDYTSVFANAIGAALLTYWVIVLMVHLVRTVLDNRARELRAAALDAELSRTRFQALSARLQPHFLFNTMNAISAFVRSDPERAETMLAGLADLLRMVLEAPDSELIPLAREVDFTRRYLDLQGVRLEGRIDLSIEVTGDLEGVMVPTLLIQPIVENAIEHGVVARRGQGAVEIEIEADERVRIVVRDNGPGLSDTVGERGADRIGLRTTRERLTTLFGDDFRLEMANRPEGGVLATIDIPLLTGEPA